MHGDRNEQAAQAGKDLAPRRRANGTALLGAIPLLALFLAGCGTSGSNMLSSMNIFAEKKTEAMTASDNSGAAIADNDDIECPGVAVRTGAATLMIGKTLGEVEPGALDLRYQGTIIRTARECHVNAGVMTIKVGIEGRIIAGPAGGPGTVEVPLRMAIVQEGVEPKTITSKLAIVPVTITEAVDRATFTHVETDIAFPMPVRLADIDAYVVYIGFDPLALQQKKKPAVKRKPTGKPRAAAKPKQG
jgi:hypothetical protein